MQHSDRNANYPRVHLRRVYAVLTLLSLFCLTVCAPRSQAQVVNVTTHHNDNARVGANTAETRLTPANVNSSTFARLFSYPVDGQIYAQPLVMTGVAIAGKGTHNIVVVATEHDSVYAFDADSSAGANAAPLWKTNFLNAGLGITTVSSNDVNAQDINPEIGITGTPVIDAATNTLYVVSKVKQTLNGVTNFYQHLHALSLADGSEKFAGPVQIATASPTFNALTQNQRGALLLANGNVYITWASHGDKGTYHGWCLAYNAATLAQVGAYNTSPTVSTAGGAGIWMSGGGPASDASGNIFLVTGNGPFDAFAAPYSSANNFGNSFLKLTPSLSFNDFFAPYNANSLNDSDVDVGSSGLLLLPDAVGDTAHPHKMVSAGKEGRIYLVDRDRPGHFQSSNDSQIIQSLPGVIGAAYGVPTYWNGYLYYSGLGDYLKAFQFQSNNLAPPNDRLTLSLTPSSQTALAVSFPSASIGISANGLTNGIAWCIDSSGAFNGSSAILRAYDATDLSHELFDTASSHARDYSSIPTRFCVPVIANGKVYIATQNMVSVFGNIASSVSLLPTDDSMVIAGNGTSFGATNHFFVINATNIPRCVSYLKFDLRNVSTAPALARLSLVTDGNYTSNMPDTLQTIKVYGVADTSWSENAINWFNAPGLNTATGNSTGTLISSATMPIRPYIAVDLDVTSYLQNHLGQFVTLQLVTEQPINAYISFNSKEAAGTEPTLLLVGQQSSALTGLTVSPASVIGGASATGTVTLNSPAPTGGVVVGLSDDNASVSVPTSVTVPGGATTAPFAIATTSVVSLTTATVTAAYNGARQTAPLTVQPNPSNQQLSPIADAYVQNGAASASNFGTAPVLDVQNNPNAQASYLKFDLSGITTIPTTATLKLTINAQGASGNVKLYGIADTSWTETGITWNNAPGLDRANVAGAGTLLATQAVSTQNGQVASFDVTGYVVAHLGQAITFLAIDETNENATLAFYSRENSVGQPVLALNGRATTNLIGLTLTPVEVTGGANSLGKVTLANPAPVGGVTVALSSGNAIAGVPASVIVPPGATSALFNINTSTVIQSTTAAITATLGSASFTQNLGILHNGLSNDTFLPESDAFVSAGVYANTNFGTLPTLAVENGRLDRVTYLRFDLSTMTNTPASAQLVLTTNSQSYGNTSLTVKVYGVGDNTWNENAVTWNNAPALNIASGTGTGTLLTSQTVQVQNGGTVTFDVTSYVQQNMGHLMTVQLVDETAENAAWCFNSREAAAGQPQLIVGYVQTANLTGISVNPASVTGGQASTGTVTLDTPAPSGGIAVTLNSNNPAATVPDSVTVPANATSATFPITTTTVSAGVAATLSGSYNNVTKTALLTINPVVTAPQVFSPVADSFVINANPDTNFGSSPYLIVENQAWIRASYLKFDLSNVSAPPATAQLKLTVNPISYGNPALTMKVYGVADNTWTEMGITWNNAPGLNHATGTGTGTLLATQYVVAQGGSIVSVDVTSYVASHIGQQLTFFLVDEANEYCGLIFNSREASAGQPQLVLSGTGTGGGPVLPTLIGLSLSPPSVVGGVASSATVTLSAPAPTGGITVSLSSNNPAATLPSPIVVPANATTATAPINTGVVGSVQAVTITASYNGSNQMATLTVNPVSTGVNQTLAPIADALVDSSNPASNFGSSPYLIVENQAWIRASYLKFDLSNVSAPPATAQLKLTVNPISYGNPALTMKVYGVADNTWTEMGITWNNAPGLNHATGTGTGTLLATQYVVAQGGSIVSVDVTSYVASHIGQQLTFFLVDEANEYCGLIFNSREASAGQPQLVLSGTGTGGGPVLPTLIGLSLSPANVVGGASSTGTVTLSVPAPTGGVSVSLSVNNAAVTVPATVVVAANATTATFTVSTNTVTALTNTTVTASYNGVSKTAGLAINPPAAGSNSQFFPIADSLVTSAAPDTNFGSSPYLIVENQAWIRASYLKFDLSNVSVPPATAQLKLTVNPISYGNPALTMKVYGVADNTWTEMGITWNNAPGLNHATGTGTGTLLATQYVVAQGGSIVSVDVTSYVASHIGQQLTFFLVDEANEYCGLIFNSREASAGQPCLKLNY